VRANDIARVSKWLDALHIGYVVVGGSAIELRFQVGTKDVDVLIAVGDWGLLDQRLEHRVDASPLDPYGGTIRGTRVAIGASQVDVEFISGQPFGGTKGADAFLEYVRRYHSSVRDGVRYADPATVWYMRLSTEDWETYSLKIEQDLVAGVPSSTFDEVLRIAAHFAVRERVAGRIEFVRRTLRLFAPSTENATGRDP
jgi:hypothetical protein